MYTEASSPNFPSKVFNMKACFDFGSLSSPSMDFSYHMYGAAMGTLNLQVSTNSGASWTTVWTRTGDQGNAWLTANVDLSAYGGQPVVGIRWNGTTGSSFTSDMTVDEISIEDLGGGGCDPVNFSRVSINAYGSGQDQGTFSVQDGGATLFIQNNAWKSINFPYTVTSNTYLHFDFRSTVEGEIHGVGFDSDDAISNNLTFQVHGTQNWGILNYNNYVPTNWTSYVINVGAFFTGTYDRLTFLADMDASPQQSNSYFRDVIVAEGACSVPMSEPGPLSPIQGDELEPLLAKSKVFPNPFSAKVSVEISTEISQPATLTIYDPTGKFIFSAQGLQAGQSLNLPTAGLASGMYLMQIRSGDQTESFRLVKE
jgi:hypothetical protein